MRTELSAFEPHPRISVIIPVFNDADGVARCLGAIAEQTYPLERIEVIVVDNGSTDPISVEVPHPFVFRVLREKQPGSYAARNAGARAAEGDILAFTDADCWPDPDWLTLGVHAIRSSGGRSIVGGEVAFKRPIPLRAAALYQLVTGFGQADNVRARGFAATANMFCTRHQFQVTGPFDTRLLSGGDREWCWRARKGGFATVFCQASRVHTFPRNNLSGAIRQARRVAAGRKMLRDLGLAHLGGAMVGKHRSTLASLRWLLGEIDLSFRDRLRVYGVATMIYGATMAERLRLFLGGSAERR